MRFSSLAERVIVITDQCSERNNPLSRIPTNTRHAWSGIANDALEANHRDVMYLHRVGFIAEKGGWSGPTPPTPAALVRGTRIAAVWQPTVWPTTSRPAPYHLTRRRTIIVTFVPTDVPLASGDPIGAR